MQNAFQIGAFGRNSESNSKKHGTIFKKGSNVALKKTIYINGRFLTQTQTGAQRYAREIITGFDNLLEDSVVADRVCIRCLVPPGTPINTAWKNITVEVVGVNTGNLWEQVDLPLYLKGKFVFSPANSGPIFHRNQAVTFHDASIFAAPYAYSHSFRLKYQLVFRSLASLARIIFTNSEFSQTELSRYLRQPAERFKITYLAGDHICRIQPDERILSKYDLSKDQYVIAVGNQSPHKNLAAVRRATASMPGKVKVIFVGGQDRKVFAHESVQDTSIDNIVLGYVRDAELKALYQNALACILPSHYEGFGLPALEAMHCGCPVLCARAGALPEIAENAALFFDPRNANEIVEAINRIYSDQQLRDDLIQKGTRRVKDFHWQVTARRTMDMMLESLKTQRNGKRIMEMGLIVLSAPFLVLLFAVIMLLIKLNSHGPVFYRHRRIGLDGKVIGIWKFRTMVHDADRALKERLKKNPALQQEWEENFKLKDDPRITLIGRFLRRTSLDELPQIWNVLKGEMSLIGPRPIVEEEIPLYGEAIEIYKQVTPGLTGLWQISGRNDLPYQERIRLDVYYIQNWSIWLDVHILAKTVLVTLQARGAY
jgi:lipopolysaccharide/colanic/teichoic acid biosynthesis glycosyltransferase